MYCTHQLVSLAVDFEGLLNMRFMGENEQLLFVYFVTCLPKITKEDKQDWEKLRVKRAFLLTVFSVLFWEFW